MAEDQKYANYIPTFFECESVEKAREIILTGNDTMSTEDRWREETKFLTEEMGRDLSLSPSDLVLDYGCGIGRVAKALVERFGCRVMGLDISASMRSMALEYVNSPLFSVISPADFDILVRGGLKVDHTYAIWVLQHTYDPKVELQRIKDSLKPGGKFYLVNEPGRCVPCDLGWVNDGVDIFKLVPEFGLKPIKEGRITLYPMNRESDKWPIANTYQREG
jgi:ubiquinone/menaquinone biosynthesis C-methylase UbiE